MKLNNAIDEGLLQELRALRSNGSPIEDGIRLLRERGVSKLGSIRLLHLALDIDLGDAKSIIYESPTWEDRKASDEAFAESAVKAFSKVRSSEAA